MADIPDDVREAAKLIPKELLRKQLVELWKLLVPMFEHLAEVELTGAMGALNKLAEQGKFSTGMNDGLRFAASMIALRLAAMKGAKREEPPELFKAIDELYASIHPEYRN